MQVSCRSATSASMSTNSNHGCLVNPMFQLTILIIEPISVVVAPRLHKTKSVAKATISRLTRNGARPILGRPWSCRRARSAVPTGGTQRLVITSTVSIWFCRVDMLELTASILGGKPPVYG